MLVLVGWQELRIAHMKGSEELNRRALISRLERKGLSTWFLTFIADDCGLLTSALSYFSNYKQIDLIIAYES